MNSINKNMTFKTDKKTLKQKRIQIPESKSLANRFLILSSFKKRAPLPAFENSCEDIEDLREALDSLKKEKTDFRIRFGGTSLRFLLARLSREKGHFRIFASPKLLDRPHTGLKEALLCLGVQTKWKKESLEIESDSWSSPPQGRLSVNSRLSSQFASSLLLSCVNLPFPLQIQIKELQGSQAYLEMTLDLLKRGGVNVRTSKQKGGELEIEILPFQKWDLDSLDCEKDMSSAFSVAAVALASGTEMTLEALPQSHLQADSVFVEILEKMRVEIHKLEREDHLMDLHLKKQKNGVLALKGIQRDLSLSPDLFPVLATLSALLPSTEKSSFLVLESLKYKESDRLKKTIELLEKAGAKVDKVKGVLSIQGPVNKAKTFSFNPDQDHRMAMAAAVLMAHGLQIQLKSPEVVKKSFPQFWEAVGLNP